MPWRGIKRLSLPRPEIALFSAGRAAPLQYIKKEFIFLTPGTMFGRVDARDLAPRSREVGCVTSKAELDICNSGELLPNVISR
jgi:hypothetical protein